MVSQEDNDPIPISDISFTRMNGKSCLLIRCEDQVLIMLLDTSDQDNLTMSVLDYLKVDKNIHSKIFGTELGAFHMVVSGEAAKNFIEIDRIIS